MSHKKVHLAEIVRHGTELVLPEGMSYDKAIAVLERRKRYEDEEVKISKPIGGYLWDGAIAFQKAMEKMFGFANAESTRDFFGTKNPPELRSVECGYGKTMLVPWGAFSLPGIEGQLQTGMSNHKGKIVFCVSGIIKRKHVEIIDALCDMTKEILAKESIYSGRAFAVCSANDMPIFMDTSQVKLDEIIFSASLEDSIKTNLFTPITESKNCRQHKIPLKRGVLLSGPYGTGKTLTCSATAKVCEDNGWTFVHCKEASILALAVDLAKEYQPAVVFCEDVDSVLTGERDDDINGILNIVDGIDSKHTEIMVVLTTNHVEKINKAMLRPGRLDAVIHVAPPDAEAAERLVKLYARGLLRDEDISEPCAMLAGKIPAVIRECVERSKLTALRLSEGTSISIGAAELLESSNTMQAQLELLEGAKPPISKYERLGKAFADMLPDQAESHNRLIEGLVVISEDNFDLGDLKLPSNGNGKE